MYNQNKLSLTSLFRLILSTSLLFIIAMPVPTMAAELEEVTVTATRRGETDIQVTPISVTALNEEAIDNLLMHDLGDMAAAIPGFVAGNAPAFDSFNPSLRGVGKDGIIIYVESPVGVSVDDFVLAHVQTQALQPFDFESIEVLRGPQGTLFGKNTTAGVINVRTKRPVLNERSLDVSQMIAEFGTKETKYTANYGGDTLAFRAAGMYQNSDGYYEAGKTSVGGGPAGDGRDLAGDDVYSGRFKLLWQPNDDFTAFAQYEIIRDNGDSPVVVNESVDTAVFPAIGFPGVKTGDPLEQSNQSAYNGVFNMDDGHQVDVNGFYLNMDWEVGDYTLHSVTGYREEESRLVSTYMGESRVSLFDASRDDDRETFQQELRIDSNFDGRFNYTLGGFYQESEVEFCVTQVLGFLDIFGLDPNVLGSIGTNGLTTLGLPGLANNTWQDSPSILCNSQDATAAALFADATVDLTDKFQVGFGVRGSFEKKEWKGRSQTYFQFLDGTAAATEGLQASLDENLDAADFDRFPFNVTTNEAEWIEPSYRVTASYSLTDDLFAWVTYSHSVKSGAYNDQTGTSTVGFPTAFTNLREVNPINPEFADSVEVGLKMDFFNNRLRANAVFFTVDYDDAQRQLNVTVGNFQETRFFNAGEMEVHGVEFETSLLVTDNLTISGNFAWTESRFNKFEADTNFDGVIDKATEDFSGREVNRAPEWTGYVTINYEHLLGNYGTLNHNLSGDFVSDTIFTYSALGTANDAIADNRTLVHWSTTFTDNKEKYFVRAFGKNLFDERHRTGNLAVATLWTMASYGAPRQFGAEVGYSFGF